ncbi:unnamed protein product, partial [Ixodes hexagonus]
MSTGGRRLPCWCRGRERAPLESLPIFQFLKAQYQADGHSALVASAARGLGRGRPLSHFARPAGATSPSDSEDEMNIVESFHREQRPLALPSLSQISDSGPRVTARAPRGRPSDPKPKEVKRFDRPQDTKRCIEGGWKIVERAVQSNAEHPAATGGSRSRGKKAASLPARVPTKKPSFDPAEFRHVGSLEWGSSWATARGQGERSDSSEDDDQTELGEGDGPTAMEKRALAEELHDTLKLDSPEGSVSSLSECQPEEVASESGPSPRTFEMSNLPESVTAECLFEVLAPFSEVTSVALVDGTDGVTAQVTVTKDCSIAWIKQCLEGASPFG